MSIYYLVLTGAKIGFDTAANEPFRVLVTANDTNPVNKEDEVKEISDEAESDKE